MGVVNLFTRLNTLPPPGNVYPNVKSQTLWAFDLLTSCWKGSVIRLTNQFLSRTANFLIELISIKV